MERDREETAIAAVGITEAVVKWFGGAVFWVIDLFHCETVSEAPPICVQ